MSKKALFFTVICVIGLFTWSVQAITITTPSTYELNLIPNGYDEIVLRGDMMFGINPNAIEAGANDDEVYIQFNQSFGNVNIAIYDSNNNLVVYNAVVDTSIQQVVIIPISSVAPGTYTVVLNKANDYAEGDFEKE